MIHCVNRGCLLKVVFDHDGTLVDTTTSRRAYEGIVELLEELFKMRVPMYIWTARDRASTLEYLKGNGLLGYFEELWTSTDGQVKPSPQGLFHMLGEESKDSVYVVGDSPTDMFGAKKYGAHALAALWAEVGNEDMTTRRGEMRAAGADVTCASPEEVMKYIKDKNV